jgi:hypothetical protein
MPSQPASQLAISIETPKEPNLHNQLNLDNPNLPHRNQDLILLFTDRHAIRKPKP